MASTLYIDYDESIDEVPNRCGFNVDTEIFDFLKQSLIEGSFIKSRTLILYSAGIITGYKAKITIYELPLMLLATIAFKLYPLYCSLPLNVQNTSLLKKLTDYSYKRLWGC